MQTVCLPEGTPSGGSATRSPRRSSGVGFVRQDTETITRLDQLAERTSRSRGFYLKAAIQAMLPAVVENYWSQQATIYDESVIDRELRPIMDHELRPRGQEPDLI